VLEIFLLAHHFDAASHLPPQKNNNKNHPEIKSNQENVNYEMNVTHLDLLGRINAITET